MEEVFSYNFKEKPDYDELRAILYHLKNSGPIYSELNKKVLKIVKKKDTGTRI